jgi:hypothetical protein
MDRVSGRWARVHGRREIRSGLVAMLVVGALGISSGGALLGATAAGAVTRGHQHETVTPYKNVKVKPPKGKKATTPAVAPGYVAMTALIDADSVTTDDGVTDGSGPISLEQYALESLGYTVTVVPGATWDGMTAAQFAQYQLLVVGDPFCSETAVSATTNASTWVPVVMGDGGGSTTVGNRTVIGTDPEYHYLEGAGAAQPTDPSNPQTGGAEHMVEDGLNFAGAVAGATGLYFDTSCFDNGSDVSVLNQLTTTSGTWTEDGGPPCGGSVSQIASNPAFSSGPTVMTDNDIEGWSCSDHVAFPTFPPDFDALAVATDTATTPTCGTDPDTGGEECGEAYILLAGEGVVVTAPNLSLTPVTNTDVAGGSHTVTATVTQGSPATPVSGAVVSFALSGQNSGVAGTCTNGSGADPTCATDANGTVEFTYPDTNGAGTDTIDGSVTIGGTTEHATASETWTPPSTTQPTQLSTALSGGTSTGADITVPTGTAVTDQATLSGANAASATGTVTYSVFSDSACTVPVGTPENVTVAGGVVPPSTAVTLSAAGNYYWVASYGGDTTNGPSSSTCGSEVATVSVASTPPTCVLSAVINGPPKQIEVTVQATGGLAAVTVTEDVNDSVSVGSFTSGATTPVVVTATKDNQSEVAELALKVTDQNGSSTSCDPADFSLTGGPSQSASNLTPSEHFVTITNDGLRKVSITTNGVTRTVKLTPSEISVLNLKKLFTQPANSVVVKGTGHGTADVLFAD